MKCALSGLCGICGLLSGGLSGLCKEMTKPQTPIRRSEAVSASRASPLLRAGIARLRWGIPPSLRNKPEQRRQLHAGYVGMSPFERSSE